MTLVADLGCGTRGSQHNNDVSMHSPSWTRGPRVPPIPLQAMGLLARRMCQRRVWPEKLKHENASFPFTKGLRHWTDKARGGVVTCSRTYGVTAVHNCEQITAEAQRRCTEIGRQEHLGGLLV